MKNPILRLVYGIDAILGRVEEFLLSILFITMLVLAFMQMVARNGFNSGFPWADTTVRHLVLWVGFIGATIGSRLDQLLTLEVLTKYLPKKWLPACAVITKLFAIFIFYILSCEGLTYLKDEMGTGEKFCDVIPYWWVLTIIPGTFILIAFHLSVNVLKIVFNHAPVENPIEGHLQGHIP